jgi:DNA processing protein
MTISITNPLYPRLLKQIHNPPKALYSRGDIKLLARKSITIVGTRDSTQYGKEVLDLLIKPYLKALGVCIVSGMARGIDTLVHHKCLSLGIPTIAVIAGGIGNIYPKSNIQLYKDICRRGLVISEFDGVIDMKKGMFPMRNRILAGLSEVTVVVEAGIKSGSLVTANLALESNRDVYVIPGNIFKNTSSGCNNLIKEGAGLIGCEEDFEQIFGIEQKQLKMS